MPYPKPVMRMLSFLVLFLAAVILAAAFVLETSRFDQVRITFSDADVAEYAATAHVRIGGVDLQLPFIALPAYRRLNPVTRLPDEPDKARWRQEKEALVAAASDPVRPMQAFHLTVAVDGYGVHGEVGKSQEMCPKLEREWSRALCLDLWHPMRAALPPRFELVDVDAPEDQIALTKEQRKLFLSLLPLHGAPAFACEDTEGRSNCVAGVPIQGGLAVAWRIHGRPNETVEAAASREGRALKVFVESALGEEESYKRVLKSVCELGAPDSTVPVRAKNPCAAF